MAQSNNPFRGGNVVHRFELPRRARPARRTPAEPAKPVDEPVDGPGEGPTQPAPHRDAAARTREVAPDPAHPEFGDDGEQGVVNVEFEVLDGSRVPHAQLNRSQERQVELELALQREASAKEELRLEHREEVEFLNRRLTKLRGLLEAQEVDLRRAVSEGQIDSGWASCYRGVQGLDMQAPGADLKREMLAQIFEANRELQTRIASLGA